MLGALKVAEFTPAPRWDVDAMVTLDLEDVVRGRVRTPWRAAWSRPHRFVVFDSDEAWVRWSDGELRSSE